MSSREQKNRNLTEQLKLSRDTTKDTLGVKVLSEEKETQKSTYTSACKVARAKVIEKLLGKTPMQTNFGLTGMKANGGLELIYFRGSELHSHNSCRV